jgi:hypothetical protein
MSPLRGPLILTRERETAHKNLAQTMQRLPYMPPTKAIAKGYEIPTKKM